MEIFFFLNCHMECGYMVNKIITAIIFVAFFCLSIFILIFFTVLTKFFFLYFSSLAVGTKEGYRLFSVTAVDKLECIHESGKKNERLIHIHLII